MATTADFRNGLCLNFNNDIYQVVEFQHVKPGKGNAFVRTKMKSMTTGRTLEHTFPAGHKIDTVRVERRNFQFLYKEGKDYHFMNVQTYEQTFLDEKMIDAPDLLKEGQPIDIYYNAETEQVLTCEMPPFVELEVTYTEPGVRGDTATNVTKPATVETGAEVSVPLFINQGEKIRIDTSTYSYMERAK